MTEESPKRTRYRVLYRVEDMSLVELEGEFDGPPTAAFRAALAAHDITVEYVSLVAVPVTNWTELRPKVETVTQIRFENLGSESVEVGAGDDVQRVGVAPAVLP